MPSRISVVSQRPVPQRITREPSHTFNVRFRPWQIQPVLIAPVLANDTMREADFKMRCVTDPVKNRLCGWWLEFYLFYVKFRDLASSQHLQNMILDYDDVPTEMQTTATTTYDYTYNGAVDYTGECLTAVVNEYFRSGDHDAADHVVSDLPICKVNEMSWLDSGINKTTDETDLPSITVGGDDSFTAQEIEQLMRKWELLNGMGLQELTWEEWLETQGVNLPKAERQVPEMLRYVRQFTYPSNTVDPSDGTAASAASWSLSGKATKDRYFKEPGFLFGCVTCRPKVYRSAQVGSAVGMLDRNIFWLSDVMNDDPRSSVRGFATGTGPLPGITDGYRVDVKDLFLYGDQFVNHTLTDTDKNLVSLPDASFKKQYPDGTDMDNLFVTPVSANEVELDGICDFNIRSRVTDTSYSVEGPTT